MIVALQALLYFRESVFHLLHRFLRPYYDRLAVGYRGEESDDEEVEVFAEWDEERGVLFYPPVYLQRYAAVSDCLLDPRWAGKLEKVVEIGFHDMSFMKYLKDIPGVNEILGVDLESAPLNCSSTWLETANPDVKRETPLNIQLLQGNAADPDYRLIGCDAVVSIEMIEHMLPHDLERLVHTVFGFIKPWVAVFTTPNVEFNVYFKGLKENELRRDDHFFEWTREQFNEWCSNIVSRYPNYKVSTRGVGPGPAGSARAGCCSQLALFHARDYVRQRSLSLNSMALLSEAPNPHTFSQIIGTLDKPDSVVNCKESGTDLSSIISVSVHQLLHDASSDANLPLVVHDKLVQCDIEFERQKYYVMAHDALDKVLIPRREVRADRVYEMEDVASSLNCSTFHVRRFSKQTQRLVWRANELPPYTNEVVDEISRLTKLLNLDKTASKDRFHRCVWKNINWADNAPYWNQYYTLVKQFTYPMENETEESRLLDLLSNEISRLYDRRSELEASSARLAVPLPHLMGVVAHITGDVEKVKDLLEWNGYEVQSDTVVHSSLNTFDPSVYSDSRDKDNVSNAGFDVHWDCSDVCTSLRSANECSSAQSEDGSGMLRALEEKVHELLTMTNIRRFPSEIDNIVCRLMRMATWAGAEGVGAAGGAGVGATAPPHRRWLQCKLYDLLTLKIKAVERRRNNPLLECGVNKEEDPNSVHQNLAKFKEDKTAERIVNKYYHLVEPPVIPDVQMALDENYAENNATSDIYGGLSSAASETIVEKHEIEGSSSRQFGSENTEPWPCDETVHTSSTLKLETSRSDTKTVTPHDIRVEKSTTAINTLQTNRKAPVYVIKSISSAKSIGSLNKPVSDLALRCSNSTIDHTKKPEKYSGSCNEFVRTYNKGMMMQRKLFNEQKGKIPDSLIELCHPELRTTNNMDEVKWTSRNDIYGCFQKPDVKKNKFIEIITEDLIELVDLSNFNQDSDKASMKNVNVVANTTNYKNNDFITESVNDSIYINNDGDSAKLHESSSQTLFLYDLNEPSTSKGIRHICTDAQCGPDTTCPLPSPVVSQRNLITISTGIRIVESVNETPDSYCEYDRNDNVNSNPYEVSRNALNIMSPLYDAATADHMPITNLIVISKHDIICGDIASKEKQCLVINEHVGTAQQKSTDENVSKKILSKFGTSGNSVLSENILSGTKETNMVLTPTFKTKLPIRVKSVGSLTRLKRQLKSIPAENVAGAQLINTGKKGTRSLKSDIKINAKTYSHRYSEDVMYQGVWQKNAPKTICKKVLMPVHKKSKESLSRKASIATLTKSQEAEWNVSKNAIKTKRSVIKLLADEPVPKRSERVMKNDDMLNCLSQHSVTKQRNKANSTKLVKTSTIQEMLKKMANDISNNIIALNSTSMKLLNKTNACKCYSDKDCPETTLQTIVLNDNDGTQLVNYTVFHNEITMKSSSVSSPVIDNTNENICSKSTEPLDKKNFDESNPLKEKRSNGSPNKTVRRKVEENNSPENNNQITPKSSKRKIPSTHSLNVTLKNKSNGKENHSPAQKTTKLNLKMTKSPCFGLNRDTFLAEISPEKIIIPSSTKFDPNTPSSQKKTISHDDDVYQNTELVPESVIVQTEVSEATSSKSFTILDSLSVAGATQIIKEITDDIVNRYETIKIDIDEMQETNINERLTYRTDSTTTMEDIIQRRLCQNKEDDEEFDSVTVILNLDDKVINTIPEETVSELSFQETSLDHNINFSILKEKLDALEEADIVNRDIKTVESDCSTKEPLSLQSVSTYRLSDNYLADNEQSFLAFVEIGQSASSQRVDSNVGEHDATLTQETTATIFERKMSMLNASCPLAAQAFSGFSVNLMPRGEEPDYVNLVDSETGSIAGVRRQTMSEEAMVSSSDMDSFESCVVVEEDSVVPEWLFQFINNRDSEIEPRPMAAMPLPLVAPVLDVNGNVAEPGTADGAGDGCGVHSDTSATTSSSFDSTDTAQETESVIMDPPSLSPRLDSLSSPAEFAVEPQDADTEVATTANVPAAASRPPLASDCEADVSSLETDERDST